MHIFTAVVDRFPGSGLHIGYIPGLAGAHTQDDSLNELNTSLTEVVALILEDGEPILEAEFVGTRTVRVRPAGRPCS